MMQELKKYQINIFDESYTVISDESEKEVRDVVLLVDSMMREIVGQSTNIDKKKVAIFAALKLAKKMLILQSESNRLKDCQNNLINIIDKDLAQ